MAIWESDACADLIGTTFYSRVFLANNRSSPPSSPKLVFESDGPGDIIFTWEEDDALDIGITEVARILRSLRSDEGVSIDYSLQGFVLQDVDQDEAELYQRGSSLSAEDRRMDGRMDEAYIRYLEAFKNWAKAYVRTVSVGNGPLRL